MVCSAVAILQHFDTFTGVEQLLVGFARLGLALGQAAYCFEVFLTQGPVHGTELVLGGEHFDRRVLGGVGGHSTIDGAASQLDLLIGRYRTGATAEASSTAATDRVLGLDLTRMEHLL